MKKWGIVIAVVAAVVIIWETWSLYYGVEKKLDQEFAQASATARQHYHVKKILNVTYYHGTKAYDVVKAVNQHGKKEFIWIPYGKGKSYVRSARSGWGKGKVIQLVQQQLHPKKLISVRLGIEEHIPVWEVSYIDQNNRYTFYYLRYDNGEWLKNIHLSK